MCMRTIAGVSYCFSSSAFKTNAEKISDTFLRSEQYPQLSPIPRSGGLVSLSSNSLKSGDSPSNAIQDTVSAVGADATEDSVQTKRKLSSQRQSANESHQRATNSEESSSSSRPSNFHSGSWDAKYFFDNDPESEKRLNNADSEVELNPLEKETWQALENQNVDSLKDVSDSSKRRKRKRVDDFPSSFQPPLKFLNVAQIFEPPQPSTYPIPISPFPSHALHPSFFVMNGMPTPQHHQGFHQGPGNGSNVSSFHPVSPDPQYQNMYSSAEHNSSTSSVPPLAPPLAFPSLANTPFAYTNSALHGGGIPHDGQVGSAPGGWLPQGFQSDQISHPFGYFNEQPPNMMHQQPQQQQEHQPFAQGDSTNFSADDFTNLIMFQQHNNLNQ